MRKLGGFLKDVAAPALIACWIAYLGYGAVAGASGYRRLTLLQDEATAKRSELETIIERRQTLARRAELLNPHSLDPDMVDERVRAVLGFANPDDLVIPRDELDRMVSDARAE